MAAYYVLRAGGRPEGPIRKTEICRMVESGELGADDQVASSAAGPWTRVRSISQLAALLPGAGSRGGPMRWPGVDEPTMPSMSSNPFGAARDESAPGPVGGIASAAASSAASPERVPPPTPRRPVPAEGPADPSDGIFLFPAKLVDVVVARLAGIGSSNLWFDLSALVGRIGHVGLVLCGAVALIFGMRLGFGAVSELDLPPWVPVLVGVVVLAVLAVLQYGAWRFLQIGDRVLRNSPSRMSGLGSLQFVGLLMATGAFLSFCASVVVLGQFMGRVEFIPGVVWFIGLGIYLLLLALLCFTPRALNVVVDEECSAGEDGIGIIGAIIRANMAAARVVFGLMCGLAAIVCVLGSFGVGLRGINDSALIAVGAGLLLAAGGALVPIASYVVCVLYSILPDLVSGVIRHTRARERERSAGAGAP